MSEKQPGLMDEQLHGLSDIAPFYDYEGLTLPDNLRVDALFANHDDFSAQTPDEIKAENDRLRNYDVIIIEAPGWTESLYKTVQKITKGDYRVREKLLNQHRLRDNHQTAWNTAWPMALYDTRAHPILIDPPKGHPAIQRPYSGIITVDPEASFAEAIEANRTSELEYAERNMQRENFMLGSFADQTNELLQANPKLRAKDGISVAIWGMGSAHAGIYRGMEEVAELNHATIDGSASFYKPSHGNVYFDYHSQIIGRQIRGLEVDDLLVAKHLVLNLTFDKDLTITHENITQRAEGMIRQLDQMELEGLADLYADLQLQLS